MACTDRPTGLHNFNIVQKRDEHAKGKILRAVGSFAWKKGLFLEHLRDEGAGRLRPPWNICDAFACWATLRGPRIARQKASYIEWAKDMVQSTKTAELRCVIELERERNRLLNCLQEVNEDGARSLSPHASDFFEPAQAELMELNMEAECSTLRHQIAALIEDEYALARRPRGRLKASKTKKRHTQRAGESPRVRRGSFGLVDIVRPRLFATAVGDHDSMCSGCFA
ncbi:hypothetical protein FB107DRAFT_245164 [Schizophyllum commune]